ncbi:hypothetical protein [Acidaminobacter hydrogenoformans]|uniref:Uncharacterized protein n=1 Tax=Acidaminobacter hydrogenoformans DSM 2784 TaxID=1120920 RepID=A0A1G5S0U6_9FIRM|nr:hypothetical protein [Acidaminobacter hydrogenoformans]SCZ79371.1 hypothetical protein SAMN03080599_01719 [Acidaminobacter hydrogenoformans DSM 2784]
MHLHPNLRRSSRLLVLGLSLLLLVLLLTIAAAGIRARVIMKVSSWQQYAESPLKELGVRIDLPTGQGWFDDLLFYHDASGLKSETGVPLDLSIYYNFGAFEKGRSLVYTPGSGYYGSFYGAYIVTGPALPALDARFVERVAAYDYETLILRALGHPSPFGTFEVLEAEVAPVELLMDIADWTRYEVQIQVPGVAHIKTQWRLHYWQFGTPPPLRDLEPFERAELHGRLYVKSFEAEDMRIIVYMLCESPEVLERLDERIRSEGRLQIKP